MATTPLPPKFGALKFGWLVMLKNFRAELESCAFLNREILEDGEVHAVEAGTRDLSHATERGNARHRNATRRAEWEGGISIVVQYARLGERSRVSEPTELPFESVWRPNFKGAR